METRALGWLLLVIILLINIAAAVDREALEHDINVLISEAAQLDNVSYSFAVSYFDRHEIQVLHVFAGADDRNAPEGHPSARINDKSLFPAGSVAKPFTTLAALILSSSDSPTLDLDAPAVPIADEWLKKQGLQTVTEIFLRENYPPFNSPGFTPSPSNLTSLAQVSVRDLLSMTGGIYDYDDKSMELWSKQNPCSGSNAKTACDILPHTFMTNMSHSMPYCKGKCVMYSGNSFIIAGYAIAAAAGAYSFQDLDVLHLINSRLKPLDRLNNTLFMGPGPCSSHPHVVHQYGVNPEARGGPLRDTLFPYGLDNDINMLSLSSHDEGSCASWGPNMPNIQNHGNIFATVNTTGSNACCDASKHFSEKTGLPMVWTWTPTSSCVIIDALKERSVLNGAISGASGPPPPPQCGGSPIYPGVMSVGGKIMQKSIVESWKKCCYTSKIFAQTKSHMKGLMWSWQLKNKSSVNGECVIMYKSTHEIPIPLAVTGHADEPPAPLNPSDFYDLYDESCLNGWTMGNIAIAPPDLARFYYLLFNEKIVEKEKLEQMLNWKPFSKGWNAGAGPIEYGMGMMRLAFPAPGVDGQNQNWTLRMGHPGEDWGSSIVRLVGWWPALNASLVLASNTLRPMNFSGGPKRIIDLPCELQNTVAKYLRPDLGMVRCRST